MKTILRLFICSFLSIVSLTAGERQFTIADIWGSDKFTEKKLDDIQWVEDGKSFMYKDSDRVTHSLGIYQYFVKDQSRKLVVNGAHMSLHGNGSPFSFTAYELSPDGKRILFVSPPPKHRYLSRLTPDGNYFLYDIDSKSLTQVTNVSVPQYNHKFSPDGSKIGFVRDNNIFIYDIRSKQETQVTADGAAHIINGKFDWVYEEEFEIHDGWQWSSDGSKIAFWRLDENRVPVYTITEWDSVHPTLIPYRYPKPGDRNSIVTIGVYDLASGGTSWLDLGSNDDMYIPRMVWTKDNATLAVERLNRAQNKIELFLYNVNSGEKKLVLTDSSNTWIEVTNDLHFLKNNAFTWASERDGYRHIYVYNADGMLQHKITSGSWDVGEFYGVDEKTGTAYYSSAEVSPVERQLYSVRLDGSHKRQLSSTHGTHSANFSPTYDEYIESYSSWNTPKQLRMMHSNGKELYVIEPNEMSRLQEYSLGQVSYSTFKTTDGTLLHTSLLKPVDFDPSKKYPVLVYTYGGPGSQVVTDAWGGARYLWYSMLASKGYLVFMVDNRGTGARGTAFKTITYHDLGKWEVHDQIEGAKYLASLPFVDKTRIGIWGWSYGGYMSCLTILKGADYFKTAVAVSPVTNWQYYDDIYTERYMGMPKDNPQGYFESSPINYVGLLKGKFLLIHGTSDDNVHFQNSANLVFALENAGKQFSTMYYPDKNHGISGKETRTHLFTLITNFLLQNL